MKFLGNSFLVVLFIPLFLIAVFSAGFKFRLLNPDFWQTTFRSHDVYTKLSTAIKTTAEIKTVKEGGSLGEARILINLVTPAFLQDFLEKNLVNILNFANGKTKEAVIYIPIKVLPKGLIPKNFGKITENTPLETLLAEFNIQGIQKAQIESIGRIGAWATGLLTSDLALLFVILTVFILVAEKGSRLAAPGIAFILSGITTLLATLFGYVIRGSMLTDWVKGNEPIQIILAPFAPYILGGILNVWLYAGIFAVLIGIVLLFLRKKQ